MTLVKKMSLAALLIFCTTINSSTSAKLKSIAPPLIDPDLSEYHHKLDHYDNKLDYKDDDYLLLYAGLKPKLFDMKGNKLREWNFGQKADIKRARLLKNCNLMFLDGHNNKAIREINFAGDVAWSYRAPGMTHHDFEISDEGNVTLLYRIPVPEDFQINNNCSNNEVLTDAVLEVNRSRAKQFEWFFHEHYLSLLNKDKCTPWRRNKMAKSRYSKRLDWAHPNALNVIKNNKWFKQGYSQFKPGNIIVTSHHLNRIFIIEKATKKVVWVYKGGDVSLDGPHEAKMIPEGLPGAGNIMIFDNGKPTRKYSRVIEVNPITKKVVWEYSKPGEFFNKFAGSQQRLKNGHTFISDDVSARAFIVNKKGDILWQFSDIPKIDDNTEKFIDNNGIKWQHIIAEKNWLRRARLYPRKDFAHCLKK